MSAWRSLAPEAPARGALLPLSPAPPEHPAVRRLSTRVLSPTVFLAVFGTLWLFSARRVVLINDEGIYLDAAARMLSGQAPYRDFFALTGPECFLLHSLVFRWMGISLATGRFLVIFDIAVLAAGIFGFIDHFRKRALAVFVASLFVVSVASNVSMVTANHRWDSSAHGLIALALVFYLDRTWRGVAGRGNRRRSTIAFLAGAMAASAACITPPVALVGLALMGWLACHRETRLFAGPFIAGSAATCAVMSLWLAWHGALVPMATHLLWSAAHYSGANRILFGGIIGGYAALFDGVRGLDILLRTALTLWVALPAILAIVVFLWWPVRLLGRQDAPDTRRGVGLLLLAAGAFVCSCYPRMDVGHLTYASPLFWVLAALLGAGLKSRRARLGTVSVLAAVAAMFVAYAAGHFLKETTAETRVGRVRGTSEDLRLVRALDRYIPGDQTLFVFPYTPIFYFLTRATNPTSYSFLQPGMMSPEDEALALGQLRAQPPAYIIYSNVRPEEYLRIWPSSDPSRLRMRRIEAFIASEYATIARCRGTSLGFDIKVQRGEKPPVPPPSALD